MRIPLDRSGNEPLYLQIAAFLRAGIEQARIPAGARLPAIRTLAQELGVNRITVESAYGELEAAGLVAGRVGSGTFVLPPYPGADASSGGAVPGIPPMRAGWPAWQDDLLARRRTMPVRSTIPLRTSDRDASVISLSSGNGDPRLFPVEAMRRSLRDTMREEGLQAAEYAEEAGYAPLRRTIAHLLADQGIPAAREDVLITAGSQQAIALIVQLLTIPGDTVFVEAPTYADGLDLFRGFGLHVVAVPMDAEGMRTDELARLLEVHRPRFIYSIPNFHNPTGICMSGQRRRQLVQLAAAHGIPLVEDDFVGELRYEGHAQPALKALAAPGACLYVGTFSKMLMPGLRVGYLVAEGPVREMLIRSKRQQDLSSSGIIQRALYRFVSVGQHRSHLARCCQVYRKRRDALLQGLAAHVPSRWVQAAPVTGGLFVWCRLAAPLAAAGLVAEALQCGVALAPGTVFYAHPADGERFFRMNFAMHDPDVLDEAMRRLGAAVRRLT